MTLEALKLIAEITTPLANLSGDELLALRDNCPWFTNAYPAMAEWIVKLADSERRRRETDECKFPDPPAFWDMPGDKLAACLRACIVLARSTPTDRLRDVADALLQFVAVFVSVRLAERSIVANN